jgi:two-component sensor histidine kinase
MGQGWNGLPQCLTADGSGAHLSDRVISGEDHIGGFHCEGGAHIEAWSSIIEDEAGVAQFRLVAVAPLPERRDELLSQIEEKDTLLRELQHRVKNNLQMITALIRLEARQLPDEQGESFQRLAGRINSLSLLYSALYEESTEEGIDLGAYLSQVASAAMAAQASEGVRLNLQVDSWPCSINVAMPTGLVVNELMTNSLKHAFPEGRSGTIKVHALVDETGCKVVVADDGVGLPEGEQWPKKGKLSALIVHTLRENAGAKLDVQSEPGVGVTVTIFFARSRAEPEA